VTEITLKKGKGRPKVSDLTYGEVAIDEESLTLWGKSTLGGAVARVGLGDYLALDGTNKMDANIDVDGFTVTNLRLPTDDGDAVNKQYVDMSMDWERISSTGFNCVVDQQYIIEIIGSNPYVNLPSLGVNDIGKFVVLADGSGVWDLPGRHLTLNLNGPLQGQSVGQLVLDIPNVIVTMLWDGYSWIVFSTMASTGIGGGSPWTETAQGIEYSGRIDTGEVHTHALEAEYILGTPRRHYEAVFGRAVPLDEELDSIEKRSVRHGADIQRIERLIQDAKAEEVNNPVVHEAVFDDKLYGRQNGEWVPVPTGGGGDGHDIAAMFFWETKNTFGTAHEGQRWVQFNVAETYNNAGYDLMLPDWSLVHQVELQVAYFKGKNPNSGAQYNPRVRLKHINFKNEVIKEDVLIHNQEMGWGQGFERDEQMFQVRLERGASKIRIDIDNVDGSNLDTSVSWEGKTYKNLIAVNGMYLTTDESQA